MFHCYHNDRTQVIPGRATMVSLISTRSNYSSILTMGAPRIVDWSIATDINSTTHNNLRRAKGIAACNGSQNKTHRRGSNSCSLPSVHRSHRETKDIKQYQCIDMWNIMNRGELAKKYPKNLDFGSIMRKGLMNRNDLLLVVPSTCYNMLSSGAHGNSRVTQMETIYPTLTDMVDVKGVDCEYGDDGNDPPNGLTDKERSIGSEDVDANEKVQKLCVRGTINKGRLFDGHFVHFTPDAVRLECYDKVRKLVEYDGALQMTGKRIFIISECMINLNAAQTSGCHEEGDKFNRVKGVCKYLKRMLVSTEIGYEDCEEKQQEHTACRYFDLICSGNSRDETVESRARRQTDSVITLQPRCGEEKRF